MLLEIQKLFAYCQQPCSGEQLVDCAHMDFPGYTVPEPVQVSWKILMQSPGEQMKLSISIQAKVVYFCARCTDEAAELLNVASVFEIRKNDWEDIDAELPFDTNGRLPLAELCYQQIISEVPSVLLCSQNCGGLCPICGRRNPCACTQETNGDVVDERLAILKTLL